MNLLAWAVNSWKQTAWASGAWKTYGGVFTPSVRRTFIVLEDYRTVAVTVEARGTLQAG